MCGTVSVMHYHTVKIVQNGFIGNNIKHGIINDIYSCVQWLEKDFLGYLAEWKASVDSRTGISDGDKARMCLSRETLEGLHITGKLKYLNFHSAEFVYGEEGTLRLKFY